MMDTRRTRSRREGTDGCVGNPTSLERRWKSWLAGLALAAIGLKLAVLPKTEVLVRETFLGSLWFPAEEGALGEALRAAHEGLLVYSVGYGLGIAALVVFAACTCGAALRLGGLHARRDTCAGAALLLVSVLLVKDVLSAMVFALTPAAGATLESLRFKAGLSLAFDSCAPDSAAAYLMDKIDFFGVGSVALSAAWLRNRMRIAWRPAVIAMTLPALSLLAAGLAVHLALAWKVRNMSAGLW